MVSSENQAAVSLPAGGRREFPPRVPSQGWILTLYITRVSVLIPAQQGDV